MSHQHLTINYCRINQQVDFSADFHVYRLEWLLDGLQFYIDDELIGEVYPPAGGFWELGGFRGQPIWASGTKMAPFDQRVLNYYYHLSDK